MAIDLDVMQKVAKLIDEYQTLKERDATEDEFAEWRDRVKRAFPYGSGGLIAQIRDILDAKTRGQENVNHHRT